jgi:hypothetical protein
MISCRNVAAPPGGGSCNPVNAYPEKTDDYIKKFNILYIFRCLYVKYAYKSFE